MKPRARITRTASAKIGLGLFLAAAALAQAAFKLPPPEKLTLKNGLTVYFRKSADLPLISFQMWLRAAGSASEPSELEGVAGLTRLDGRLGQANQHAERRLDQAFVELRGMPRTALLAVAGYAREIKDIAWDSPAWIGPLVAVLLPP